MTRLSVEDALARSSQSLGEAISFLWELDTNRLVPEKHYRISPQSQTENRSDDAARVPLCLLDNYVVNQGVPERVSEEEKEEEERFLECICESDCVRFVYDWLRENGYGVASSMDEFKEVLADLWFGMYDRGRDKDSSAFEHVFCGEIDGDDVKGLHNYIQVYIEEQRGNFDYMGYVDFAGDLCGAPVENQHALIIRFEWFGCLKSVSSMFIGTSPEYEIALYTLLWFSRDGSDQIEAEYSFGRYLVQFRIYSFRSNMTTAFPCLKGVDTESLEEDLYYQKQKNEDQYDGGEAEGDQLEQVDAAALNDSEEFPPLG
ncbi:poly(U)-specific endoribonuclease-B [Gracilaria domingensis]|nr:poly(U)-specific endoribonuclease-B [Gracilaria domingensis]